jgi:hypothetical protein
MITEIVTFPITRDLDRDAVVALYEQSAEGWRANPDLIQKTYLFDPETRTGGGVYLWPSVEAAKSHHGEAFQTRVRETFGGEASFAYFEAPVLVDNR